MKKTRSIYKQAFLIFLLLAGFIGGIQASPVVNVSPGSLGMDAGQTRECVIFLDRVPDGLSRFQMKISLSPPGVAEIIGVRFPQWAGLNSRGRLPADSMTITGADVNNRIRPGDRNVPLVMLVVRGDGSGSGTLILGDLKFEDEQGIVFAVSANPGQITIGEEVTYTTEPEIPVQDNEQEPWVPRPVETTPSPDNEPAVQPSQEVMCEGGLMVTSIPGGAEVSVDELPVGSTPLNLTGLACGTCNLFISKDGYEPMDLGAVEINSGQVTRINDIVLTPAPVGETMYLQSDPRGAEIIIDNTLSGNTPGLFFLTWGEHHLVFRKSGYEPREEILNVRQDQQVPFPIVVLVPVQVYTIASLPGLHGTVTPASNITVTRGGYVELSIVPDEGYAVLNVSVDGQWAGPLVQITFSEVDADHRVEALFVEITPDSGASKTPPDADFMANVTKGRAPLAVAFSDQSNGTVTSREWQFGDGNGTQSGEVIVHTYTLAGNYTVNLTVCNDQGCDTAQKAYYIQIDPAYVRAGAGFTSDTLSGISPLMVQFRDNSTGSPESWLWDFGDGTRSTEQNPVHIYASPGNYTVRLTVTSDDNTDTKENKGYITATAPAIIGGEIGYYQLYCNIENASVYLDGVFQGRIAGGSFIIPVYVTGKPHKTFEVRAEGYLPYAGSIPSHPGEKETIAIHVILVPQLPSPPSRSIPFPSQGGIHSNKSLQWPDI